MITHYPEQSNKRQVQKNIYNHIVGRFTNLVALGGPSLDNYLRLVSNARIKNAIIYENNRHQLMLQMKNLPTIINTTVIYKDILTSASGLENTLYDLDFCYSIQSGLPYIKKFKYDPTIYTFSMRPFGFEFSVNMYVKTVQGSILHKLETIDENNMYRKYLLHMKHQVQHVYAYKDSTPMLVIHNLNQ